MRAWGLTRAPAACGTTAPAHAGKDPLVRADKPVGEWNTFHIIQVGARTTIYLNDKLVVDNAILENYWKRELPIPARGPIQLQTHDHEIHWRNISVREIAPDEANQILAKRSERGLSADLQRPEPGDLGRADRKLRGQGRRAALQAAQRRHDLLQPGTDRLHGPSRVQAARRRQQRSGDPLSRQGRHSLRRHVRAPDPRRW